MSAKLPSGVKLPKGVELPKELAHLNPKSVTTKEFTREEIQKIHETNPNARVLDYEFDKSVTRFFNAADTRMYMKHLKKMSDKWRDENPKISTFRVQMRLLGACLDSPYFEKPIAKDIQDFRKANTRAFNFITQPNLNPEYVKCWETIIDIKEKAEKGLMTFDRASDMSNYLAITTLKGPELTPEQRKRKQDEADKQAILDKAELRAIIEEIKKYYASKTNVQNNNMEKEDSSK